MLPRIRKLQKRRRQDTDMVLAVLGILVVAAAVFLAFSNFRIYKKGAEVKNQIKILKDETERLEQQKQESQFGIAETETEEYLEKVARERFNLKKPEENVVAIVMPQQQEKSSKEEEGKKWWQRILEKFGF